MERYRFKRWLLGIFSSINPHIQGRGRLSPWGVAREKISVPAHSRTTIQVRINHFLVDVIELIDILKSCMNVFFFFWIASTGVLCRKNKYRMFFSNLVG